MQADLPVFYGNKMRRKMKAGAGCEDLRVRCPHYYTVATALHAAMQVGAGTAGLHAWCRASTRPCVRGLRLWACVWAAAALGSEAWWRHAKLHAKLHARPVPAQHAQHTPAPGQPNPLCVPVRRCPCFLTRRRFPARCPLQASMTADEDFPAFVLNTFRKRYKVRPHSPARAAQTLQGPPPSQPGSRAVNLARRLARPCHQRELAGHAGPSRRAASLRLAARPNVVASPLLQELLTRAPQVESSLEASQILAKLSAEESQVGAPRSTGLPPRAVRFAFARAWLQAGRGRQGRCGWACRRPQPAARCTVVHHGCHSAAGNMQRWARHHPCALRALSPAVHDACGPFLPPLPSPCSAVHCSGRGLCSLPPLAQQRGQPTPDTHVQREAQVGGERRRRRRECSGECCGMMAARGARPCHDRHRQQQQDPLRQAPGAAG